MYTDDYGRTWHGPYPFTHASVLTQAPESMGVYEILYSGMSDFRVVYIGIGTGTIRDRLRKHVSGYGNWVLARLGDSRLGDPRKYQFVYYECDELDAKQIESHVIMMNKPLFNTKNEKKHFILSISIH